MIGFNHAIAGAAMAKILPWPLAIPAALASHFLLDAAPHYGIPQHQRDKSKFWKIFFTIDFFAALSLAFWAIKYHHYAMYVCGQIAVVPDFVWVAHVIKTHSFNLTTRNNRYERWHKNIQHFEYPWGIWLELPLAVILFYFVIVRTN